MLNTNYVKLTDGYPQYLRLPIRLSKPITIGEVSHPAGAHLSTNDDAAIKELGYKPADPNYNAHAGGILLHRDMDGNRNGYSAGVGGTRTAPATDYTEVLDIMTGEKV